MGEAPLYLSVEARVSKIEPKFEPNVPTKFRLGFGVSCLVCCVW